MRHKWDWWHCTVCVYFTNDGTESLPCNLKHLVRTQPVVMHQFYMANVIDNTAPLIFFFFLLNSFIVQGFTNNVLPEQHSYHAVSRQNICMLSLWLVLKSSGTTEGRDRMINKELWVCFDEDWTTNDFKFSSNPSSQFNSFAVQTHIHKCLR